MSGFLNEDRPVQTLRAVLTKLQDAYCSTVGFEVRSPTAGQPFAPPPPPEYFAGYYTAPEIKAFKYCDLSTMRILPAAEYRRLGATSRVLFCKQLM